MGRRISPWRGGKLRFVHRARFRRSYYHPGHPPVERWFFPAVIDNPGDPRNYTHFNTLFADETLYAPILNQIDVWGAYLSPLILNENGWLDRAVPMLQKYNVKWVTEGGYIQAVGCDAAAAIATADATAGWIAGLYSRGSQLDYFQIDDQLYFLMSASYPCQLNTDTAISVIVAFYQQLHSHYPQIQIGTTISMPNWPAFGLPNYYGVNPFDDLDVVLPKYISALADAGERLCFVHFDDAYEFLNGTAPGKAGNAPDMWQQAAGIERLLENYGIPVSPIYNNANANALNYIQWTLDDATTYRANGNTRPRHYVVQDWTATITTVEPMTNPASALHLANSFFGNNRGTHDGQPAVLA